MTTEITVDSAGRVLIPKPLRKQLHLGPGDTLQLESDGDRITLSPIRQKGRLIKKHGILVFQSGAPVSMSTEDINDFIDQQREKRSLEAAGLADE
jgi:AbrB family looped-hinge helix DNA binding protein